MSSKPLDPGDQQLNQPLFLMALMVLDSGLTIVSIVGVDSVSLADPGSVACGSFSLLVL